MEIVIAILLAMILVAMVSSNKDAATGVMGFINIALAALMMLAIWGIVLGYSYWAYISEDDHGWFQIILTVAVAITPPAIIFMARKDIVKEYKSSKKSFFKKLSLYLLYAIGMWILAVLGDQTRKNFPFMGTALLIAGLLITGNILLTRTFKHPTHWKLIWFSSGEPFEIAEKEFQIFEKKEKMRWAEFEKKSPNISEEDKNLEKEKFSVIMNKAVATRFEVQEELEKKEYKEDTVLTIFWWFFVFICFGLISIFWDFAFPFVLAFGFVNGHSWLATIILTGLIVSTVVGVYTFVDEFIIKNNDQR